MGFVNIITPTKGIENYKSFLKNLFKDVERKIELLNNKVEKISLKVSLPAGSKDGSLNAFFSIGYYIEKENLNAEEYRYDFDNLVQEDNYYVFYDIYHFPVTDLKSLEIKLRKKLSKLIENLNKGKIEEKLDVCVVENTRRIEIKAENSKRIDLNYYEDILMDFNKYKYNYTLSVSFYDNSLEIRDNIFRFSISNLKQEDLEHYKNLILSYLNLLVSSDLSFENMKFFIYKLKNSLKNVFAEKVKEVENYNEKFNTIKFFVEKNLEKPDFYMPNHEIIMKEIFYTFPNIPIKEIGYETFYVYLIPIEDEKINKSSEKEKNFYISSLKKYLSDNLKELFNDFYKEKKIYVDLIFDSNSFYLNLKTNSKNLKPNLEQEEVKENLINIILEENLYKDIIMDSYGFFKYEDNQYILKAIEKSIKPISELFELREKVVSKILEVSKDFYSIQEN